MSNNIFPIILASASPRRRELLSTLIDDFEIRSADVNENVDEALPYKRVEAIAKRKADAIDVDGLIISADTLVFDGEKPLGKPKNRDDAFDMLKSLSGKVHKVYSGVCLKTKDKTTVFSVETDVEFRTLSDDDIRYYIETFNPLDKAGAYGIQDGFCVSRISGSYANVVGLPIEELKKRLIELNVTIKE